MAIETIDGPVNEPASEALRDGRHDNRYRHFLKKGTLAGDMNSCQAGFIVGCGTGHNHPIACPLPWQDLMPQIKVEMLRS
jgi:hypothetical protein